MWQFFSNEVSFVWLRPPTHRIINSNSPNCWLADIYLMSVCGNNSWFKSPNCWLVDYIYLMSVQTVDWLMFIWGQYVALNRWFKYSKLPIGWYLLDLSRHSIMTSSSGWTKNAIDCLFCLFLNSSGGISTLCF
jgi:hypothetical protein